LAARLLEVRGRIRQRLIAKNLQHLVSNFDPDIYSPHASVGENIVFGVIDYADLKEHRTEARRHINSVLKDAGILDKALETGLVVATRLVDVYRDVGGGAGLLAEFGLDDEDQIEALAEIVDSGKSASQMDGEQKDILRILFQRIVPARHRFVSIDFRLTTKLVQVRRDFAQSLPAELAHLVEPFVIDKYHPGLSVKDNILFGRLAQHQWVKVADGGKASDLSGSDSIQKTPCIDFP